MPADLSKVLNRNIPVPAWEFPETHVAGGWDCIPWRLSLYLCPVLIVLALASGVCQSLKGELGPKFIEGGFSLSPVCSAQPVEASTCLIISTFKIAFCLSGSENSPDWKISCSHLRSILSVLPLQSGKWSETAGLEWEEAAKIWSQASGILMSSLGMPGHVLPRLFPARTVL